MNCNITLWDPPIDVEIHKSVGANRVVVSFGDWPAPHNTWFLNESDLDILIMKLLDAKVRYKDGQPA